MKEASKAQLQQFKREVIQGLFAGILFTLVYAVWYSGMRNILAIIFIFITFFLTWVLITWIIYRIRLAKDKSNNKET